MHLPRLAGAGRQKWFGLSLHRERLDLLHLDRGTGEPQRLLADKNLTRLDGLLEAGGDVDGVAGGEALLRAGDDLARVDAGAQLKRDAVVVLELVVERFELVAELDGSAQGGSASSSCTVGTPKTAMTASPMNFSTVPPWRSRDVRAATK